jgi:hypothetical protein
MEFRPTRMLTGRFGPIVVNPIRRRPLDKSQGRISANAAGGQTHGITAGRRALKKGEPQQGAKSARFSPAKWCAPCGGCSKSRVVRRRIRLAFTERINTRY